MPVSISAVVHRRSHGGVDAANIIGGIADALEEPFYKDDSQIAEVYYKESPAKKKMSLVVRARHCVGTICHFVKLLTQTQYSCYNSRITFEGYVI